MRHFLYINRLSFFQSFSASLHPVLTHFSYILPLHALMLPYFLCVVMNIYTLLATPCSFHLSSSLHILCHSTSLSAWSSLREAQMNNSFLCQPEMSQAAELVWRLWRFNHRPSCSTLLSLPCSFPLGGIKHAPNYVAPFVATFEASEKFGIHFITFNLLNSVLLSMLEYNGFSFKIEMPPP